MALRMSLSFAATDCDRCGASRLLTQPCPECGLKPRRHETQPDLERRRKILKEFKSTEVELPLVTDSLDDAIGGISSLISGIQRALAEAARGGRSAHGLVQAFAKLDAQVAYWSQRHPRPTTNRARSFGRSISLLRDGFGTFAQALAADTMLEAQEIERRGQELIDSAADKVNELHGINEVELLLSGPSPFSQIGEAARAMAGGDEALATLDVRLRQMAGSGADPSQMGIGLNVHILRHLMLVLLDLEQAMAVADAAEKHMVDLPAICRSPLWQARHGIVTAQFSTAAFNLSRVDEHRDLEAVSVALNLVMQCRDGVVRHCLATMFAQDAPDYERLSRRTAGAIIQQAARERPELCLDENLSPIIRHAAAHFDYDVTDEHFVTRSSSGDEERLTIDEFIDAVLGYFQTSVSLLMALIRASASQGVQMELSRHTPERDLLGVMAMLMGFLGFADVSIERSGTTLRIAATGDVTQLTIAIAGVTAVAPSDMTKVEAQISVPSGPTSSWKAPLEAFRLYAQRPSSAYDVDDTIALARLMSCVRIDSRAVWDGDMWAGVGMHVLQATEGLALRERVIRFKEVRDLSIVDGSTEISRALTHFLEDLRQGRRSDAALTSPFIQRPFIRPRL